MSAGFRLSNERTIATRKHANGAYTVGLRARQVGKEFFVDWYVQHDGNDSPCASNTLKADSKDAAREMWQRIAATLL